MELLNEIFGAGCRRYERVKRAVALIGFSRTTIYRLIGTGDLIAKRIRGTTVIDMASAAALFTRAPRVAPVKHVRTMSITDIGLGPDAEDKSTLKGDADLADMALADAGKPATEAQIARAALGDRARD
jgi:hypothetical protein